jgi:hypothetical protein
MRKLYLTLITLTVLIHFSDAQNTFPSSGNVGIGTTTPELPLDVNGSGTTSARIGTNAIADFWGTTDRARLLVGNSNNTNGGSRSQALYMYGWNLASTGYECKWELGTDFYMNGTNDFYFWNGLLSKAPLYISSTGNIGVGTMSPSSRLAVFGSSNTGDLTVTTSSSSSTISVASLLSPNASGDTYWSVGRSLSLGKAALFGFSNVGSTSTYAFLTTYGRPAADFAVTSTGNVGIGTTSPDQKLTVNGTIHSSAVVVNNAIPMPDYVFQPSYKLIDLPSLNEYLHKYHHLPEIPSDGQIQKEGLNLGQMNTLLLKKVEELTLYLIEKDQQFKKQKDISEKQEIEIEQLKKDKDILEKQQSRIDELEKKLNTLLEASGRGSHNQ